MKHKIMRNKITRNLLRNSLLDKRQPPPSTDHSEVLFRVEYGQNRRVPQETPGKTVRSAASACPFWGDLVHDRSLVRLLRVFVRVFPEEHIRSEVRSGRCPDVLARMRPCPHPDSFSGAACSV